MAQRGHATKVQWSDVRLTNEIDIDASQQLIAVVHTPSNAGSLAHTEGIPWMCLCALCITPMPQHWVNRPPIHWASAAEPQGPMRARGRAYQHCRASAQPGCLPAPFSHVSSLFFPPNPARNASAQIYAPVFVHAWRARRVHAHIQEHASVGTHSNCRHMHMQEHSTRRDSAEETCLPKPILPHCHATCVHLAGWSHKHAGTNKTLHALCSQKNNNKMRTWKE